MNLARDDWSALLRLLDEVLELPPAERNAWLAAREASLGALAPALRQLLDERRAIETGTFLQALPVLATGPAPAGLAMGQHIGPYALLRELGQGGMASVWLAERADGAHRREVALKLPWLGARARVIGERFAREREILSALTHPHIASVLDAGLDGTQPWLALEYVQGEPITAHAAEHALPIAARLRLFLQVLQAVQHAHAQLVIHRDIKPANVLVDERGQVKLLDFGVAKLLDDDGATQDTELTRLGGRAMTPQYASPEQVAGHALGTASDVYSLGVLLYELLTGRLPYTLKRATPAALEEAILDAQLRPPSAVVADKAAARALRGDLDTIVMKALAALPVDRYGSAESMAQDIDRHLQSLPILARPAGVGYRLRKLWARQKLALTAATAVGLSLLIGLGVAYWQALERDRQFHLAQQRLQQAETALDFVTQVVTESLQAGETVSRDAFVQRSEALLQGASLTVPTERLLVANTIAVWAASFGQYERADALLTRVLDGLPVDLDPTLAATVRCNRAVMRASQGQEEGAPAELDAMIALLDAKGGDSDWECRYKRAQLRRNGNDAAGALADIEQALRSFEAAGYRSAHSRAILVAEHGYALSLNGRIAQAEERYAAAVDMLRRAGRQDSAFAGTVHNNWGNALIAAGQPRAAIAQFDRALEIGRLVAPLGAPPAFAWLNRAQALRGAGAWRDALQAYQAGLQVAREQHAQPSEFFALVGMAATADALAQGDDARRYLAEARQVAERLQLPAGSPTALGLRITEAVLLKSEGQLTEADQRLARITEEVASLGLKGNIPSALRILRAEIALGQAHAPEAGALASEALDLARAAQGGFAHSVLTGQAWLVLAQSQQAQGQAGVAASSARQAVTQLEASASPDYPKLRIARQMLQ